jgi:fused signal recognition particle receptor
MAREWRDLFITGTPLPAPAPEGTEEEGTRRRGFFRRLRENMSKTREALQAEVQATLFEGDVDEETWLRLEEALIMADVGAKTTAQVVGQLEDEADSGDLVGGEQLSARLAELMAASPGRARADRPAPRARRRPHGRRQRDGQDDDDRQARVAPQARARAVRAARRGRHVPRRRRRAAAGLGPRADVPIVTPQREGQDPSSVAFDTIAEGAGAASTSSSSTRPGACTRRTSSWPS